MLKLENMADLLINNNKRLILLGNEAIVRGALEAGVQFVATYPGTPASEIGNNFYKIAKKAGVYFEFSTNEKTALEAVIGASFSGLKCLLAMKNFGLNVALDSLLPFLYTGTKGPTVIIVADDPSCHSSAQSEENTRGFAFIGHIPMLEPADAQECYDFVKLGFQISEKFNLPVIVRTTTRVAHQRSIVQVGNFQSSTSITGEFIKDKHKFVTMPPRVLEMHKELLQKIRDIKEYAEKSEINYTLIQKSKFKSQNYNSKVKSSDVGIVTSGVSFLHMMEALEILEMDIPVLKLGFFYPLAQEKIKSFIKPLKKLLIVEELDPYLEKEITAIAKEANCKLEIFGKDLLPEVGEFNPTVVAQAVAKITGKKLPALPSLKVRQIKHAPRFCTTPTCPYWRLFAAVKQALPETTIFGGDIGCYMIAALPPTNLYDYLFCMGSSIGIAHGIAKATGGKPFGVIQGRQKVVAFIGDGTFLHAGIQALMNAVYNQSNPLVIIGDNRITAMTGHQPNPGMGQGSSGEAAPEIKIEEIVKALQVKHCKIVDPVSNFDETVQTIKEFAEKDEVAVIIARRQCALLEQKKGSV